MTARRTLRSSLLPVAGVSLLYVVAAIRSAPWPVRPAPEFIVPRPGLTRAEAAAKREELVAVGGGATLHVPSVAELPDGRLAVAWYAGSRELAPDVAILLAIRAPGLPWSAPRVVVDRRTAARELRRPVGKVGNAVLFADGSSRLWLVFATMPLGGWGMSSLNAKVSYDGGTTWTASRRLALSPFFDLGTLDKNKPALLDGGSLLLPVEQGLLGRFPELVRLDGTPEGGLEWSTSRLCGGRTFHQPAVLATGPRDALCVLRAGTIPGSVGISETSDGGVNWSAPRPSGLPNPDAGLDAVALSGGGVLLAFNDDPLRRANLRLAISHDRGVSWRRVATIEDENGAEFSYPSLLQARSGDIHLVYTWKRRAIKHVEFNEAWLEAASARSWR